MTLPDGLVDHLSADVVTAWPLVAAACPPSGVLMGGTALTVHLHHRISRDLDVFVAEAFAPDELEATLAALATFAVTQKDEGTLNGILGATKVQFLHAAGQTPLEVPVQVAGLDVGQVPDIMATKLKVIGDRGELRDYFDLLMIEEIEGLRVEEGLGLLIARYGIDEPVEPVGHICRALGFFDDVAEDPSLPLDRREIEEYWRARQPEVLRHLDRYGF